MHISEYIYKKKNTFFVFHKFTNCFWTDNQIILDTNNKKRRISENGVAAVDS